MHIERSKKIILHIIVSFEKGGIETILYNLISNESNIFKHVIISFRQPGFYGDLALNFGIKVYSLNNKKGKFTITSLFKLYKIIVNESPSIVQTWWYPADFIGGLIARLAGVKNIVWGVFSTNFDMTKIGKGTKIFAPLCAFTSRFIPKKIISCAESAIKAHIKYGYTSSKWCFIPPGVVLQSSSPFTNSSKIGLVKYLTGDENIILGCLARWDPLKDHNNLLKALYQLKQQNIKTICFLAGTGIDESNSQLMEMLKNFQLTNKEVILLGSIPSVFDFYNSIDVHILSSLGEGFPNVIIEAMSCSVPCISTDVGDVKSVIADTGWVIPVSDSEALKNAIYIAIKEKENEDLWKQRTINCRNRVEKKYSLDKMVTEYGRIWETLI